MSATGTGSSRGLAVLQRLTKQLTSGADSPGGLFTRPAAAKRLGVSPDRLRRMLMLGQLTRVRVRGREFIYLY